MKESFAAAPQKSWSSYKHVSYSLPTWSPPRLHSAPPLVCSISFPLPFLSEVPMSHSTLSNWALKNVWLGFWSPSSSSHLPASRGVPGRGGHSSVRKCQERSLWSSDGDGGLIVMGQPSSTASLRPALLHGQPSASHPEELEKMVQLDLKTRSLRKASDLISLIL